MSDGTDAAASADEHTLVLPESWLRRLHPRRGGAAVPAVEVDAAAPGEFAEFIREEDVRAAIDTALRSHDSEPEAVEALRRHLAGDADPAGAAMLMSIVVWTKKLGDERLIERCVDAWIAEHGPAFAGRAVAELGRVGRISYTRYPYAGKDPGAIGYVGPAGHTYILWFAREVMRKVRALLAAAGDDEYEDAVKHLADHRTTPAQQAIVSYLVPTRHDWVEETCATLPTVDAPYAGWLLWCSLGGARHVELAAGGTPLRVQEARIDLLATILEGVGSAVTPQLAASLNDQYLDVDSRRLFFKVLAMLPTDEAFQVLVERLDAQYVQAAVNEAARRYPARAMRLLASGANGTSKASGIARDLLSAHVAAHRDLVAGVLPTLPADVRATVESLVASTTRLPDAPADALPSVLVTPPWTVRRKTAEPVVVAGLVPPGAPALSWAPGERDAWAVDPYGGAWNSRTPYDDLIRDFPTLTPYFQARLLVHGPRERVDPLLQGWAPKYLGYAGDVIRQLIARFELDALPLALRCAQASPARCGPGLLPFLDPRVAALQASWLMRLKSMREHAVAWFERHGLEGAMLLVPDAVGRPGAARANAEGALRHVASRHGDEVVVDVARRYGDEAARAIGVLLATDPLEILPSRIPKPPDWADPLVLPQVLLRDREWALPVEATRHLLTMLAMCKPGETYAGVGVAGEACDPESLAEFSWALFRRWQVHDTPSKESWALTQLGLLGDDDTVRRLAPIVRAWPGEGGHSRAVQGLDVLAAIGTDVALMHLHGIAQKVKFKGLRTRAQEKIEQVAAELELTPEQLADRLVPDLGLDADGGMTFDYGPRRFTVGFDAELKPYVLDEDGKRRKALPKPGAKDTPDLAPAAYKRFGRLKKDVRMVASEQIRRMEQAMVAGRRWPLDQFHELFVSHPLVWHIVRRLVLSAEHDGTVTTFRIAEDRTYADVEDETVTLPGTASIGIPHPLDLGEEAVAWSEVFADYEILQPFRQLGRPVHTLTDDERATERLTRFEGVTVPTGKVLGLQQRGWERAEPQDAGQEPWISREIAPGRHLVIDLDPGIAVGAVDMFPEQTLAGVRLAAYPDWDHRAASTPMTFGDLTPAAASEALADLVALTEIPAH